MTRVRWVSRDLRLEPSTLPSLEHGRYSRCKSDTDLTRPTLVEGGTRGRRPTLLVPPRGLNLYGCWYLGVPHNVESGSLRAPDSGVLHNVE